VFKVTHGYLFESQYLLFVLVFISNDKSKHDIESKDNCKDNVIHVKMIEFTVAVIGYAEGCDVGVHEAREDADDGLDEVVDDINPIILFDYQTVINK